MASWPFVFEHEFKRACVGLGLHAPELLRFTSGSIFGGPTFAWVDAPGGPIKVEARHLIDAHDLASELARRIKQSEGIP